MDPENWTFDVFTADHDAVKHGVLRQRRSRVIISRSEFHSAVRASEVAATVAVARWGGMPTEVLPVY